MTDTKEPSSRAEGLAWPLLLLGIFSVAWFRSSRKSRAQPVNTGANSSDVAAAQHGDKPEIVVRSELIIPEAQQQAEGAYRQRQIRVEYLNAALSVMTLFAVVAYAVVSYFQLKELHSSTVRSNRAWVGVLSPPGVTLNSFGENQQASVTVVMKNFGPAVALHVVNWASPATKEAEFERDMQGGCQNSYTLSHGIFARDLNNRSLPPMISTVPQGHSLFPGDAFQNHFGSVGPLKGPFDGSDRVVVLGCISYRDQFGEERQTRYCYVTDAMLRDLKFPAELKPCIEYNDAR